MGIEILVTNEPGVGSRFTFILQTSMATTASPSAFVLPDRLQSALISADSSAFDQIFERYLSNFELAPRFL